MPEVATRELSLGEAVREALAEEMRRDPRVCLIGEDVAEADLALADADAPAMGDQYRAIVEGILRLC